MKELFDPLVRVTLLEQCERFSRETGATVSVLSGYPEVSYQGSRAEIHLSKFHLAASGDSPNAVKEDDGSWLLRYYFEDLLDYRNLKRALLSCFGKKAKTDPYSLPRFDLPRDSYDKLMADNRVYLGSDLAIVKNYEESTYIFIVLCKNTIQYCQHWGLDRALYRTCEVLPAKSNQSGAAL